MVKLNLWKELHWDWKWSEIPPFFTGSKNTECVVQSSLDRKLANMKSSDISWGKVWKADIELSCVLHSIWIFHVLFCSLTTLKLLRFSLRCFRDNGKYCILDQTLYNLPMEIYCKWRFIFLKTKVGVHTKTEQWFHSLWAAHKSSPPGWTWSAALWEMHWHSLWAEPWLMTQTTKE